MAKKTRTELKALWNTGYVPTESDFDDLFDSILLDADTVTQYTNSTTTVKFDNPLRGNVYGTDAAPLSGAVTISYTNAVVGASAVILHNGSSDPFASVPANTQKWNYTYSPGKVNIIILTYYTSTLTTISCMVADETEAGKPYATSVSISGTTTVTETLTGNYTFNDDEGHTEGTTLFRWLRADTSGGTYAAIAGATSSTYTLASADEGKYIKFEVTPVATTAPLQGDPVQSSATAAIAANAFSETDLSDILTYFDASNDSSITHTSNSFESATDSNLTTTNDWADYSAGSNPTYSDAGDSIEFQSTNLSQIGVDATDVSNMPGDGEARTVAVAFQPHYAGGSAYVYLFYSSSSDYVLLEGDKIKIASGGSTQIATLTDATLSDGNDHMLIIRSGDGNNTEVRWDGSVIAGGWSSSDHFDYAMDTSLQFSRDGNSAYSFDGYIYKILVTSSYMSSSDLTDLETKWTSDYSL